MRRFEFAVDRKHAHAVNEVFADLRRLRLLAIAAAVVAATGTALLIWLDHPWAYLLAVAFALGAVTALWVALWTPWHSSIDKLYADGELVPAVVSEARPSGVVLLALVDVSTPDTSDPRYALVTRKVRDLPGHKARAGERVPSVAVRTDRAPRQVGQRWQSVSAMPIAWGTTDGSVIARARAAISEAEWRLLTDNLALAEKVRRTATKRLLLDPHHLPGDLGS
ncbi:MULTISPECIES: DUF3239 domain-containing protein [Nocardia]|uniref:Membrane protein n=1 Tax=Nocardia sputorum TaxID=2984338 RepID=A0ABN6TWS2_9NOCA|nr:DUF3239 domain-containing protein [Nocardia sputorum]BDT95565.1 membrane protein [Nocardia sputorum]BDT97343.1 membrane protein [Nocardia sputorum]